MRAIETESQPSPHGGPAAAATAANGLPAPDVEQPPDPTPWWKIPPTDRRGLGVIVSAYLLMTAVLTLIGLAVVELWEPSSLGEADADVNRWFEDRRTPTWDTWSDYGSMLSDTLTKVVLCAVLLPVFLWAWRRWHDWTFLAGGLLLEVTTFVTTATLVGRERPPVEQIDSAPTNSFPSGHIAASVVFYVGLYLLARRHTRNPLIRTAALVVAIAAPTCVVLSRLYRGMHYPTDAVAGVVLGLCTLAVMTYAIERTIGRTRLGRRSYEPADTHQASLTSHT